MRSDSPRREVVTWCWRLLPLAVLLVGWSFRGHRDADEALLPVTVTSVREDWVLSRYMTGRPL